MKVNKKMMYTAIGSACFALFDSDEIASAVVDAINKDKANAVEVCSARSNGFILRCRKDTTIQDSNLYEVLANVTRKMLDDRGDETIDHMSDKFDITYDRSYVNSDYAQEIFDVSHSGRLIYIEADI